MVHFHAAEQSCEWRQPSNFPVGILELDDPGPVQVIGFEPGDVLALLSDGIYEFANDQGGQFGEDRVANVLKYHHQLPMAELGAQLLKSVFEFAAGEKQADDITMVLIRRLPEV
ncbi:MAG: PP2C family protein-serine/threonine phosphatase [Lysobacterales bacterium]